MVNNVSNEIVFLKFDFNFNRTFELIFDLDWGFLINFGKIKTFPLFTTNKEEIIPFFEIGYPRYNYFESYIKKVH